MGDCSGGEGPAVDGILTEGGGHDGGVVTYLLLRAATTTVAALFVEGQAVKAVDAAWIFACWQRCLLLVHSLFLL